MPIIHKYQNPDWSEAGKESYESALQIMKQEFPDLKKARDFLRLGVGKKYPPAIYAMGTWYLYGANGLRKNTNKGLRMMLEAAEENVPEAMFDVAAILEKGEQLPRDLNRAFLFYMGSAVRGEGSSIFEVGRCYFYGIGVGRNRKIAQVWFERAEEVGSYEGLEGR